MRLEVMWHKLHLLYLPSGLGPLVTVGVSLLSSAQPAPIDSIPPCPHRLQFPHYRPNPTEESQLSCSLLPTSLSLSQAAIQAAAAAWQDRSMAGPRLLSPQSPLLLMLLGTQKYYLRVG